jgi:hypothetical protein
MKKKLHIKIFIITLFINMTSYGQWQEFGDFLYGEPNVSGRFGRAVSLSADGSILAVGEPRFGDEFDVFGNPDETGLVYIYELDGSNNWVETTTIEGLVPEEFFGRSLELSSDGSMLVVGGPSDINSSDIDGKGVTRVFERISSGNWSQVGADIVGENNDEYSGWSVSISNDGSTIAVGAWGNSSETGTSRIYTKEASNVWTKQADFIGSDAGDRTGYSVSLSNDGNTVAVGAYKHDSKGTTRVYNNLGGSWLQVGSDIDGETADENSGFSISLSNNGNTVAVGAYGYNSGDGIVRIHENQSGTWTKTASLDGVSGEQEQFGYYLYLTPDANSIAVGANAFDFSNGITRVYKKNTTTWTQFGDNITSGAAAFSFAFSSTALSLSDDGRKIAIGAYAFNNTGGFTNDGMVQVYMNNEVLSVDNLLLQDITYYIQNKTIYTNDENISISVYDLLGRKVPNNNLTGVHIVIFRNDLYNQVETKKIYVR